MVVFQHQEFTSGNQSDCYLLQFEAELPVFHHCVSDPSPMTLRTGDFPEITAGGQIHLVSRSPPEVHFARQSSPNPLALYHLPKVVQQSLIYPARTFFDQIIWMSNETDKAVPLPK